MCKNSKIIKDISMHRAGHVPNFSSRFVNRSVPTVKKEKIQ